MVSSHSVVEKLTSRRLSDNILFGAILNNPDSGPCSIFSRLPPPKVTGHDLRKLRKRSHGLTLTVTESNFVRKNVIHRVLHIHLLTSFSAYDCCV